MIIIIFKFFLSLIWFYWLLSLFRVISSQLYFWQLKEYRVNRILAHLKTRQGKKLLFNFFFLAKIVLLVIYLYHFGKIEKFGYRVFDVGLVFTTYFIYLLETIILFFNFIKNKFLRPKLTFKIIFIFLLALLINFGVFYRLSEIRNLIPLIVFLIVNLISPLIVILIILLLKPFVYLFKKRTINEAKKKIKNYPNLKIIGITGSFGKSSTKEFLATILEEEFKVLKTPLNINTDIGVARIILKKLNPQHEVFVVEMGAYKRGEIKEICNIVKPQIGVITGINEQHLSLFGSQENIIEGKNELIKSLPKNGLAVFNGDNKYTRKMGKKFKGKKLFYSLGNKADLMAKDIKTAKDHLEFKVNNQLFKINLVGEYNISNLLAAIFVAKNLGMNLKEIARGVAEIKPFRGTMQIQKGINDSIIIDDTYNGNPDGVMAALRHLEKFEGYKKVVVTPGLLELGQEAKNIHQNIGKKASEIVDELIITNKNYARELKEGAGDKIEVLVETNFKKVIDLLKSKVEKQTVVLLEGRLPSNILRHLI